MENNGDLLTPVEAAAYLRISRSALYSLIQRQEVPHVRLSPRCVRLSRASLLKWIHERERRESQ